MSALWALPAVWSHPEVTMEGLRLAERATQLDPLASFPKALAARCYAQRAAYMRTPNIAEDRAMHLRLAQEAASLDSTDPLVLTVLSAAYAVAGQFDRARRHREGSRSGPELGLGFGLRSGWSNHYVGNTDRAIEHFQRAMCLSLLDPMHFNALIGIGASHFIKAQFDEAIKLD